MRKHQAGLDRSRIGVVVLVACAAAVAARTHRMPGGASSQSVGADTALLQRMLDAEDARSSDSASLSPLFEGLASRDTLTRRRAARALGRLERNAGLDALRGMLDDPAPTVRAEAVNAIAQIVNGEAQRALAAGDSSAGERAVIGAVGILTGLAAEKNDPHVHDAIVRSLSRLPYRSTNAAVSAVSALLGPPGNRQTSSVANGGTAASVSSFARAYALDALVRRNPALRTDATIVAAVAGLAESPSSRQVDRAGGWTREARVLRASVRGRMLTASGQGGATSDGTRREIMSAFLADARDRDPQVRRQVISMVAAAAALEDTARRRLVDAALRDPSFHVRVEGVRAYARRANASCAPLVSATRDANAHVALTAIDALPVLASCREDAEAADRLLQLVRSIPARPAVRSAGRGSWHAGAHATVALARVDPERATPVISALATHPTWQVRMYAATAAGVVADTATLMRLATDTSDNVRDAAVNAFSSLVRPAPGNNAPPRIARGAWVDSIFASQLSRRDYQLVLDAARALEGATPSASLMDALFAALTRITRERSETSRDPRMELLARIEALGRIEHAQQLTPYLADFDPAVAHRATGLLRGWGVATAAAMPRPMPPLRTSLREVARLRDARVRITMAPSSGGGSFDLRLFLDDAPATLARFIALARQGFYDNLTFHRVATNFVIQGGSPGANEYVGHDRYLRDELGFRSHARGTLGISTRGRDTGDAQIFVNLIDNFRLDHDYTVFAEVARGMDVVDGILEGDVIARVEVLGSR